MTFVRAREGGLRSALVAPTQRSLNVVTVALTIVAGSAFGLAAGSGMAIYSLIGLLAAAAIFWLTLRPAAVLSLVATAACTTGLSIRIGPATVRPEIIAIPVCLAIIASLPNIRSVCAMAARNLLLLAVPIFLLLALLPSVFVAPEPLRSVWIWFQMATAMLFFLYATFRPWILNPILRYTTFILAAVSTVSLVSYLFSQSSGGTATTIGLGLDGRIAGLAYEPNIFASQCAAWLAVMYVHRTQLTKWQCWQSLPILVACILAGTRAAWVALALLGAYVLICTGKRYPTRSTISFLAISSIAIAASPAVLAAGNQAQPESFLWRLAHVFDTSEGTGAYRASIYDLALQDLDASSHLLIGTGLNSFSQFHPVDPTQTSEAYLSSIFLAVLYDTGVIGLISFLLVLGVLLYAAYRNTTHGPIILILLITCALATNISWFLFFWLSAALSMAPLRESESRPEADHLFQKAAQ